MTHLEKDLESPIWRHLWRDLAKHHRVVRYDARACGLSDWAVEDISLDAFVSDLETVVDAAGVERFPSSASHRAVPCPLPTPLAIPLELTHLVLYGGFAQGWKRRASSVAERERSAAMLTLMRLGWGQENPAFRQLFTSQFIPDASKEQADWFNDLQRETSSPENAARYFEAVGEADLVPLLASITVPTLVMHARRDARVPFEAGRLMAAGIPGARFVPLESRNHLFLEHEPAFARFIEEIEAFLQQLTELVRPRKGSPQVDLGVQVDLDAHREFLDVGVAATAPSGAEVSVMEVPRPGSGWESCRYSPSSGPGNAPLRSGTP